MSAAEGVIVERRRINLDVPRYDQSTYEGRAKHFFIVTNPLNLFCGSKKLEEAKDIVHKIRYNQISPKDNKENTQFLVLGRTVLKECKCRTFPTCF